MHKTRDLVREMPDPASQLPVASYLVVVADRGMASEVKPFRTFDEARTSFENIAREHGYEPEEINSSDYYDVSIWEWTENGYEKAYGY
jgi:hypothetical protein